VIRVLLAEDQAMVRGSIAEVTKALSVAEGTARNPLSAAIQKLSARNRADAARIAREKGWL
jgi:two-component system response regulator DesR